MLVDAAKHGDVEIPVLLLRAEARRARRRLPHVPGRDRGDPEAADRLLDAGQGRHGRPHPDRARQDGAAARSSSSCSSTTRSTAPCATRAASARCRTSPSAGAAGISRFVEPKRHFVKPLELSPLIAIDRERCILCYRCVRFSQEVAEDYQLVLLERGAHSYVGDLRRAPVRRAVQRQHRRAVPGRRAHLAPLPLPRAAVGHRGRGLGLHAVPGAVQRHASPCATSARCACSRATTTRSTTAGCATRAASPTSPSTSTSASPSRWCATAASCARSPGSARSSEAAAALRRAGAATRRARRRPGHQRGGPAARAPAARGARLAAHRLAPRGTLPLELHRALGDPRAAGERPRPRVRPRRAGARRSSPSTTPRSSTCACARACAATA